MDDIRIFFVRCGFKDDISSPAGTVHRLPAASEGIFRFKM
jgi:hypothetical protein